MINVRGDIDLALTGGWHCSGVPERQVLAVSSTLMMILFFLIVAYAPVLLVRYQAGSDQRGVSGMSGRVFFDPIAMVFADVEVPAARRGAAERAGEHRRA